MPNRQFSFSLFNRISALNDEFSGISSITAVMVALNVLKIVICLPIGFLSPYIRLATDSVIIAYWFPENGVLSKLEIMRGLNNAKKLF